MTEEAKLFAGGLRRMLMCRMPDDMRARIEALLAEPEPTAYALKSAYQNFARRLVLARPREEIGWNPTVDGDRCVGCGACYDFCPHGVYEMEGGQARVIHPTECVILCSNCVKKCPADAISFPPQTEYAQLLRYE